MKRQLLFRKITFDDEPLFDLKQSDFKQVVIFRSLEGLGDFLCIVPALRSLRAALPQARIALIGLPKTKALVERFHLYLDELFVFPGYPGLPEQEPQLEKISRFFTTLQQQQFDLAIQMHGSGIITNPITTQLGAKYNVRLLCQMIECCRTVTALC